MLEARNAIVRAESATDEIVLDRVVQKELLDSIHATFDIAT
jgi:hypothetical protein